MNWFHVNPNGFAPARYSMPESCDWAAPEEHYASFDECRFAIEDLFHEVKWVRFHRRTPNGKHVKEVLSPVR